MKNLQKKKPFIVIVYGPTGVGKSDLALTIAQHVPAEIINMDVGQFYTPLCIGTAKPEWQSCPTPHHLFDILNTPRSLTVVEYRALLAQKINDISERGKLPIVVGGSGFYLQSVLFPLKAHEDGSLVSPDETHTLSSWDDLHAIDPERAQSIAKTERAPSWSVCFFCFLIPLLILLSTELFS